MLSTVEQPEISAGGAHPLALTVRTALPSLPPPIQLSLSVTFPFLLFLTCSVELHIKRFQYCIIDSVAEIQRVITNAGLLI